jgi:hypothetical protein
MPLQRKRQIYEVRRLAHMLPWEGLHPAVACCRTAQICQQHDIIIIEVCAPCGLGSLALAHRPPLVPILCRTMPTSGCNILREQMCPRSSSPVRLQRCTQTYSGWRHCNCLPHAGSQACVGWLAPQQLRSSMCRDADTARCLACQPAMRCSILTAAQHPAPLG